MGLKTSISSEKSTVITQGPAECEVGALPVPWSSEAAGQKFVFKSGSQFSVLCLAASWGQESLERESCVSCM
jgi:hypothetical protein